MGEEEKKAAEEEKPAAEKPKAGEEKQKAEEEKKDGSGGGDGEKKEAGDGEATPPPPPPPEEVVMKVYMHCEGCARKVRRSLKGFEGVDEVITDCKAGKVVAKGRKAAEDPLKVVDRVQRKTSRKVELISPPPPPPKPEKKEDEKKEEDVKPKPQVKEEEPQVIAVVLKVHMHCEGCAQEIKKRILKMKGVQSAEPELKTSQVTVKGVFDPSKLVEYVYKRTGKQAIIVKTDPAGKKPDADDGGSGEKKPDGREVAIDKKSSNGESKDEKKSDEKKEDNAAVNGEDKDKKDDGGAAEEAAVALPKVVELKKNEFHYYYPRYPVEYAYPPQIFSDENPNACSVM